MLFSSKPKGFFIEQNEHATFVARTSAFEAPLVIEEARECAPNDLAALKEAVKALQPKATGAYVHAICGTYSRTRLVRRATLDLKRLKEPNPVAYLNETVSSQFRVEPDKYTMAIINAVDGTEFDMGRAAQKEVIFCGLLADEVNTIQDALLGAGVYPTRMEIGTLALLGALKDYLAFSQSKTPTLVLELSTDTTHSFIVTAGGVEASRPIPQGLEAMVPMVQKELGLKDEESARKLFYSNTFDFTGMGPTLIKRLVKELQSSIGFYEVQTGQSISQVLCIQVPPKMNWVGPAIAGALGVAAVEFNLISWLQSRGVSLAPAAEGIGQDPRWLGLFGLMMRYDNVSAGKT